jgi:5'-deoxynucleotidase YfbR-like HD superfamily hydrolase
MKNFFVEENFYSDYLERFKEDEIKSLPDDWTERIELSDLEPIFQVDADNLCQLLADANEDRLTENDGEEEEIKKALKESIDFEKLKELLPKYYYPNGTFKTITKQDLLDIATNTMPEMLSVVLKKLNLIKRNKMDDVQKLIAEIKNTKDYENLKERLGEELGTLIYQLIERLGEK